ncbi:MAG: bacteriohopanetetrol glucosamine biosynthesis glycosyltransferase HpnI [Bryobacteraceae bacterium]|nr:bacteriohopanetetrol glucosamine biosynthesis glycosyltransferase HpnI [Bryobacteraceae bacterium]
MEWFAWPLVALAAASWAYCALAVAAVLAWRRQPVPASRALEPVSVLKPLHGLDDGLEENLRSFFTQDYPVFELLFAARREDDPGLALARRLSAEYPRIPARFFVTGEPPYANAKVWSLEIMTREAAHDLLVMSDSDIRVTPEMLRVLAAEFSDPRLGVATCPYRAVPGASFWSLLETLGMNTEFWSGCFVARLVERGVHFAVGPTIAARRRVIEDVGGWPRLSQYLAEDFVLGQFASARGHGVILSRYVIEHRIGAQPLAANFAHRLRWNRSTRRSRPWGYVGQVFTNPLPLGLAAAAAAPAHAAWILAATLAFRALAAWSVSHLALRDPLCRRYWFLVPLQDLLSFVFWLAGFFGNVIEWRGRRYRLLADGRFERLVAPSGAEDGPSPGRG